MGVYYYGGPIRYLYTIFKIFKALGTTFEIVGNHVNYLAKQNDILPLRNTYDKEESFDKVLAETDLLFMWNGGMGKEQEMAEKAQRLGIPIYFCELGWLPQNGTFYFDLKGVNYASSMRTWEPRPLSLGEERYLRIKLDHYHLHHAKKTDLRLEDTPFVFVPFQVENDSQILNYSPYIKTMQQLVDFVEAYVPQDIRIYYKTHPKQNLGPVNIPFRSRLFSEGTTHDFLQHPGCRYVITINSTVGVEALTYVKPVITLGRAFYGGRKMTYDVEISTMLRPGEHRHNMIEAVSWASQGKAAVGNISSFLHMLFRRQWMTEDLKNPKKVLGLIENLTDLEGSETA
jgi:hypothetical protein